MRRAGIALLSASIAFQFGLIVETAQTDAFAKIVIAMALAILTLSSVSLGILLERAGLA